MPEVLLRKTSLREADKTDDLCDRTPAELIGMMWQLTVDAWSFKEDLDPEARLQRDVVVLKKRER